MRRREEVERKDFICLTNLSNTGNSGPWSDWVCRTRTRTENSFHWLSVPPLSTWLHCSKWVPHKGISKIWKNAKEGDSWGGGGGIEISWRTVSQSLESHFLKLVLHSRETFRAFHLLRNESQKSRKGRKELGSLNTL